MKNKFRRLSSIVRVFNMNIGVCISTNYLRDKVIEMSDSNVSKSCIEKDLKMLKDEFDFNYKSDNTGMMILSNFDFIEALKSHLNIM